MHVIISYKHYLVEVAILKKYSGYVAELNNVCYCYYSLHYYYTIILPGNIITCISAENNCYNQGQQLGTTKILQSGTTKILQSGTT